MHRSRTLPPIVAVPVPAAKPTALDEYVRASVVLAVRRGAMSRAEARAKYMMVDSELRLWEAAYDDDGISGLRDRRLSMRRHKVQFNFPQYDCA